MIRRQSFFCFLNTFLYKWNTTSSPYRWDIGLLLIFFLPIYFFAIGERPFATPDEARYVEIPREMLFFNDWITPRLNGVKYFEKPPLMYWILAFIQKHISASEAWMRFPLVVFGFIGIISTYVFGHKVFNRNTGLLGALILGTTGLWFALSHLIILDMPVSVFMTILLFCFYLGIKERPHSQLKRVWFTGRRLWLIGAVLAGALGMLTKGLMVLCIAGAIIVLWLLIAKEWHLLKPLYLPFLLTFFIVIVAPWHILVSLNNPEFLYKYFYIEHFLRYTTTIHARYQPVWFFAPILFVGFLPWTSFAFLSAKDALNSLICQNASKMRDTFKTPKAYLWTWVLFVFIFFSLSKSKLVPYILPIFPPLSLIVASYILAQKDTNPKEWWLHTALFFVLMLIAFLMPIMAPFINIEEILTQKSEVLPFIQILGCIFGGMVFVSCPLFLRNLTALKRIRVLLGLSIGVLFCIHQGALYVQKPSFKNLATLWKQSISSQTKENNVIVSYEAYHQDVPFYTNQIIKVVDFLGELEFGARTEETSSWMMSHSQFKRSLMSDVDKKQKYWFFIFEGQINYLKNKYPEIDLNKISCEKSRCLLLGTLKE